MVPDIIMGPHSFPTRMSVGQIKEMDAGKHAVNTATIQIASQKQNTQQGTQFHNGKSDVSTRKTCLMLNNNQNLREASRRYFYFHSYICVSFRLSHETKNDTAMKLGTHTRLDHI